MLRGLTLVPVRSRDGFPIAGDFGSKRGQATNRQQNSIRGGAQCLCGQAMRKCRTCQHIKRAEIDRRLAAGEPTNQIARDYELNPSSLHRHRVNCLGLGSSNAIMKETARGTAALASLPAPGEFHVAYANLLGNIDEIVAQAKAEGSLKIALIGLNSVRQTLDSQMRLSVHNAKATEGNTAAHTNASRADLSALAERLIEAFDHEPAMKERIARALIEIDTHQTQGVDHEHGT
jgi:hypothetical protein